jgi:hypothetical protein
MTTPQDKKRLSYARDRRNTYGENSKSSRKNIPRSKAQSIRADRHAQDKLLAKAVTASEPDDLASVELQVRTVAPRQWKKSPDKPLGDMLERRRQRKAARGL